MRVTLKISKFNPEQDRKPHFLDYTLEAGREMTLLSALLKVKAEIDGTLTFRASCRAAICGSCLMQVNGIQKLACQTSIYGEMWRHGKLVVGPMANLPVIKDLVVRMDPFWKKVKAITPYVVSNGAIPSVELKNIHDDLHNADGCIMCAACLSACTSFEVSPQFLGPAALAKAYRFQVDPRDAVRPDRLKALQGENGIWDCVRCNFCVEVCPKGVAPMEQIIRLRRLSLKAQWTDSVAARHITQFSNVVRSEGRLNETRLPVLMLCTYPLKMLRFIPLAVKMLLRGKMPFPFTRAPGRDQVRALFLKQRGS